MAWWNPFKKKEPAPSKPVYQGPVQKGTDEKTFRDTGKSVPSTPVYQGPVRPSDNEAVFRQTGRSTGGGGGSSAPVYQGPIPQGANQQAQSNAVAQAEAQSRATAQAQAEARRQAEQQARIQAETQAQQRRNIILQAGQPTVTTKYSTDVETGNKLEITTSKQGARKVVDVKDLSTGEITTNVYDTGKGGGGVRNIERVTRRDSQVLPTGEKVYYDRQGNPVGIEADLGRGMQSFSIEAYKREVKRLQEVQPQTAILDTKTGALSSGTPSVVKLGDLEITPRNQVQVYVDPKGKPIQDVQQYMIEKDIPFSTTPNKLSNQEFIDMITGKGKIEQPTYDVKGITNLASTGKLGEGGVVIGEEWLPASQSYGYASPATPLDLTLAVTPIIKGGFIVGQVGKAVTSKAFGFAGALDVVGYVTGANKVIKENLQLAGQALKASVFTQKDSGMVEFGITPAVKYSAGVGLGILAELPAQSKTELALDLGIGSAFLSKYKLLSVPAKTFVGGYSGYKIFTGETIEQKGLGALGILAVSPDIVKGVTKTTYRFSPDFVKTKTDATGIKYTDIDLGKMDFNVKTGVPRKEFDPLRVEFIPKRDVNIAGDIIPLRNMASDIAFKDKPSLPKVTAEQKMILDVIKQEGGIVSGSFAQQTLIRDARQFKDLDVLSQDPKKLASKLTEQYEDLFKVEKKRIKDGTLGEFDIYKVYSKKTGEHLADFDPIKFGEEGLAIFSNTQEVGGLKLLSPDIRLTSKIIQSARPLPQKKRVKVATDIAQILGEKDLATSPSLLRGYGLSKAEQKLAFLDGGDFFATHGGQGIVSRFSDDLLLGGEKVGSPDLFFSTPSRVGERVAYARLSRMGIGSDIQQASLRDLFKGEKLTFFGKKKDVLIEVGKLGDDFIQPNIGTSEIEVARVLPKEGTQLKILKRFKTIVQGEPVEISFAGRESLSINDLIKLDQNRLSDLISKEVSTRRADYKQVRVSSPIRLGFEDENIMRVDRNDITLRTDIRRFSLIEPIRVQTTRVRQPSRTKTPRIPRTPVRTPSRIREPRIDIPIRIPRTPVRTPSRIREPRIDIPIRIPPRIPIRTPDIIKPVVRFDDAFKTPKQRIKKVETYSVFIKRRGKFKTIGGDLGYGEALKLGELKTKQTLGRTFKIRKTGFKEVGIDESFSEPDLGIFRKYKIRKGKKLDLPTDTFIQKTQFSLSGAGEKREIQRARQQARQLNNLINM
jgi:hypothetical protein